MLQPGDTVVMNSKFAEGEDYKGKTWKVRSWPWTVCGTEVVLLEGYKGGYDVSGLDLVEKGHLFEEDT